MHFVTFVLKNLTRRPTRTALTALGVAVSVGAMVALLSTATRFKEAAAESLEGRGADLMVMAGGAADQLSSDVDLRYAEQIRRIPGVKDLSIGLVTLTEVQKTAEGNSFNALVQGWPDDNPAYNELKILEGRRLNSSDRRHAFLGMTLATNLKKKPGDTIYIQREPFEVVGVFQSFVVFENGCAVVPLEELQTLTARKGRVTGMTVILNPDLDKSVAVDEVRRRIDAITDE